MLTGRRRAVVRACSVLIVPFAMSAWADGGPGQQESSLLRLFYQENELVVAASRLPEEARTAPATVDFFSREEVLNMGARTLSDLLRTLESTYVSVQTNSRESLWVRGIRERYNDKVLLLVDGVPWRDPIYENAPIDEYFPLTNVERVEVIRGPGSALYGTNAYAAVINVMTRTPPDKPFFEVEAGGGDYSTEEAYVQGGMKKGGLGFYAFGHYFNTKGDGLDYDAHQMRETLRQNPKEQYSGGLTVKAGEFTLRFEKIHYEHTYFADWDVPAWRWKDEGYFYDDTMVSAEYAHRFGDSWGVKALGYYQDYDLYNFWREFLPGRQGPNSTPADVAHAIDVYKRGRRLGGDFQFDVRTAGRNELVVGITAEEESISNVQDLWLDVHTGQVTRPFYIDPVSLTTWAVYAQDTWKPSDWAILTLGVRGDHNEVFGWKVSPRVGVTFHPGEKLVFKLLYGEAFRAPSAREFYTVDLTGSFPAGNPDLKPESIRTAEASLTYTFSSYAQTRLVIFHERTDDAIFSENNRPYANHPGEVIRGVEANLKLAWPNRVTAYLNYSYTDTNQYNVPHNLAHAGVNVPVTEGLNWSLDAQYVSSRPRDPKDNYAYDPSRPPYHRGNVPGYVTVDTTFRFRTLWRGLEIDASVYDLLSDGHSDPTYEPTKYYDLKAPGRTFLVRAVYRF